MHDATERSAEMTKEAQSPHDEEATPQPLVILIRPLRGSSPRNGNSPHDENAQHSSGMRKLSESDVERQTLKALS